MPRGDKPTPTALALKNGWIYEDALPASITKEEYDWWFKESLVLDGVRIGPSLTTKPLSTETLEPMIESGGESLSIYDIMQRFRNDGSCKHIIEQALNNLACLSPASAAPVVDKDVIDVLDGIKGFYGTNDCWCDSEGDATHFGHCITARALYERLKQSSAAATAAPVEQSDAATNLLNEIDKTSRQLLRPDRTRTDIEFAVEYIVSRVTALRRTVAKT